MVYFDTEVLRAMRSWLQSASATSNLLPSMAVLYTQPVAGISRELFRMQPALPLHHPHLGFLMHCILAFESLPPVEQAACLSH